MTRIGDLIRETRERRGYGLRQLAGMAGVSPATICKIEGGERPQPEPGTLEKIAVALGYPPATFYAAAGYSESFIVAMPAPAATQAVDPVLVKLMEVICKKHRLQNTAQIALFTNGILTAAEIDHLRAGKSPADLDEERLVKFFRKFNLDLVRQYYLAARVPLPQEYNDIEMEIAALADRVFTSTNGSPEALEYILQTFKEQYERKRHEK